MPYPSTADYTVQILDNSGVPIVSFGGGTQYADGTAVATPTGTAAMWNDAGTERVASAAKPFPVNVVAGSGSGLSVADAAAWTTAVSNFVPGGGVFNDSAADLVSGTQGTLRMTAKRAQHVNIRSAAGVEITSFGLSAADKSAFTEGTSLMTPAGGVFNDTISADPTEDQAAALRITAKRGLHVNIRSAAGAEITNFGLSAVDKAAFTEGTSLMTPAGGVFNDIISADPTEDQTAALRITAKRGLHANLRNVAGTEIGITTTPLVVGGNVAVGAAAAGNPNVVGGIDAAGNVQRNAIGTYADINAGETVVFTGQRVVADLQIQDTTGPNSIRVRSAKSAIGSVGGSNVIAVGTCLYNGTNFQPQLCDTTGRAAAVGAAGNGAAVAGNPVLIAGSDATNARSLLTDTSGRVQIATIATSVTPGTAAAHLGKAEDAGHTTGDTGVFMLQVRNGTPGPLSGTDLDYEPMQSDANGFTRVVADGYNRVSVATLTRPANTTAYAAGDEMTDTSAAILSFTGCALVNGGAGIITGLLISSSVNAATKPVGELRLYDTTSTPATDNAAFDSSDGVNDTAVAVIPFGLGSDGLTGTTGNSLYDIDGLSKTFKCAAATTTLFGRVILKAAYTSPANSDTFKFTLRIG